jgi:hypothetical protein
MTLLYIALAFVALVIIIWLLLPSKYYVNKQIEIGAPVERSFEQVNELRNWVKWSPWFRMDPGQEMQYSDPSNGKDAWYAWKSTHKSVDRGKLTLTEVVPNEKIIQSLHFEKWGDTKSTSLFESTPEGSRVVWIMDMEMRGFSKFFGPMMRNALTKQFIEGLEGIKKAAEEA